MKRKLKNGISVLLAAALVISGTLLVGRICDEREAERLAQQAQQLVVPQDPAPAQQDQPMPDVQDDLPVQPVPLAPEPTQSTPAQELPDETVRALLELDLAALRQINPDVLGWIHIPDSPVDYPLLQVRDNDEYLRRAWDGTPNQAGCIFLECRNSTDFSDFNTLIYGHYMRNGKMFGSLHSYRDRAYRDAHPEIYLVTDRGVLRYEVFAAYEADLVSDTYRLVFEDGQRKQTALEYYCAASVVDGGMVPTVEDRVLTLSTCMGNGTYDTRWVVQAVLTGEFLK